jgi:predicted Zn-dependent protease
MRRGRLLGALIVAGLALLSYYGYREYNPVTGETQHVQLSADQEIALGLQAAPEMLAQFGGLSPDPGAQAFVDEVGMRVVRGSAAASTPYRFEFHLLADPETINAFALPGGQIFITEALASRLETEGQLAGVLGHEIGHVVGRHGAEHLAKAQLTQGLAGAAVIAASDPDRPGSSQQAAMVAMAVAQLVNMKFGRDDELESDRLGVRFLAESGYDPRAMIAVMEVLASSREGQGPPEFFSTHPNPDRRIERIREAVAETYPDGVPDGLVP